jgi:hypothetical protein
MRSPNRITPGYVIPGDMVRAVGYWAPPYTTLRGIDTFWEAVGRRTDRYRQSLDVLLEHRHWMNSKRPKDDTDRVYWTAPSRDVGAKERAVHAACRAIRDAG